MTRLNHLDGSIWLCDPAHLRRLSARVLAYGRCPTAREVALARGREREAMKCLATTAVKGAGIDDPAERMLAAPAKQIRAVKGKIGVIPIHGPIDQRMNAELMKADGTSCEGIAAGLDSLLNDDSVGAIVLHIDSPGGSSYGCEELSERISDARGRKPLYAISDSLCASAALWIGSAADMLFCTPGGDIGSVGAYVMHVDESAAAEQEGVKITYVQAGKYKTEANRFEPLADEARGYLQDQVNYTYGRFVDGLRRNRNTTAADVRDNYGQGRLLNPEQALSARLIDRVISFEALMNRLTGTTSSGTGAKAANAEVLRLRQAQRKRMSGVFA